jgi:glycogen debranching enzyme
LRVTYHVRLDRLEVAAELRNHAREPLTFDAAWMFDADFADIQEAQAGSRQQEGRVRVRSIPSAGEVEFDYECEDLRYRSVLALSAREWRMDERRARTAIALEPGAGLVLELTVRPAPAADTADVGRRDALLRAWQDRFTRIRSPRNTRFERAVADNVRDFASFPLAEGEPDEWLTLQAGVPLYPALFGRDAITAGWQAGCVDCGASLDAALTRLGRLQSNRVDDWQDEEPGRIPYQVRRGPLALLKRNPYAAYYADFASPLMFVIALANLFAWTGDEKRLRRHWDTARRILDWARDYGDPNRDGYLEYHTRSRVGTKNQGWKDSGDAIVYDDGTPVPPPIGTCELQGYWYAAQQLMAAMCWMSGAKGDGRAWLQSAAELKDRFNRDWWLPEERFFGLAMDPEKQLVRAASSNVGHCLATGIIDREHVAAVVGRLFAPDMFSGWGVRTLSSSHRSYNPLSYHRGSVWAVEQATIVFGLRRFGFDARALDLAGAMFDLACLYPEHRIPETVGGYSRADRPTPGAYPLANTPQLWNASAFPLLVQTLAGIVPLAPYDTLFVDPALPAWLPELVLERMRVGGATVSLRFWREADGRSEFEVLHRRGTLHVVRQPPPESLNADIWERLHGLMESLI